jgi:hypothetical protein
VPWSAAANLDRLGCEPEIPIAVASLRVVQRGELGASQRGGEEERDQGGVTPLDGAVAERRKDTTDHYGLERLCLRLGCGIGLANAFHGRAKLEGMSIKLVASDTMSRRNRRQC